MSSTTSTHRKPLPDHNDTEIHTHDSPAHDELRLHPTKTGMTISPELFEKLYLTPKTPHSGDAIKRFANPTPMGFVGFVISTFTFAMVNMGWGGANGLAGVAGIFFFVGPVLLILATIFEWIMGNFFPMMVQSLFSVFWLSFGLLQLPSLGLAAAYSTTGNAAEGAASVGYNATIGLYLVVWGFALFTFWIFTLKTNVIFAVIFGTVTMAAWVLAGAYFKVAAGEYVMAGHLQKAGGAILFITAAFGCKSPDANVCSRLIDTDYTCAGYMTFVIMSYELRMPFSLPVGDLSHFWPRTDVPIGDVEKQA